MDRVNIRAPSLAIKPSGIVAYFDTLQVWLKHPADHPTLAKLKQQCGQGGLYSEQRHARFDHSFRQRLVFYQPEEDALRWVARQDDALVNRADFAIDFAFPNSSARDSAKEFIERHLVRRWRGRNQEVRIHPGRNETRYDAPRSSRNVIVTYQSEHSRITGELDILHLEWRAKGIAAVRAAGIHEVPNLNKFDHRAFWSSKLLLREIDPERLGRLMRNRSRGTKSRESEYATWVNRQVNLDVKRGLVMINSVDCMSDFMQAYRDVQLQHVVQTISNEAWLPE